MVVLDKLYKDLKDASADYFSSNRTIENFDQFKRSCEKSMNTAKTAFKSNHSTFFIDLPEKIAQPISLFTVIPSLVSLFKSRVETEKWKIRLFDNRVDRILENCEDRVKTITPS